MDLCPSMNIVVTSKLVKGSQAGARAGGAWPAHLEPPPAGKRVIYQWGTSGQAICSVCLCDPSTVDRAISEMYSKRSVSSLARVEKHINHRWYCTVSQCGNYGDRL